VPVVSEEPPPYYPNCDYSSEEDSLEEAQFWGIKKPFQSERPYQECSIIRTAGFEGEYFELKTHHQFTYALFPGLIQPIRVYKAHRFYPNLYKHNPNYQSSPHPLYYHRLLTESESETIQRESSKVLGLYIKPEFNLWARVPKLTEVLSHTRIEQIPFYNLDKNIFKSPLFRLEDNRPIPFIITKELGIKHLGIKQIGAYIKNRYLDWIWAGGLQPGNKFFIDLWDPEVIKAIDNPKLDKHPRVRLVKEWKQLEEQQKQPTPKKPRKRTRSPDIFDI
jgi:hypothetical protein